MMPGALHGIGIKDLLNILAVLLPILSGFYAERLFKARLYGRIADIVIGCVGGWGLSLVSQYIMSAYYSKIAEAFYADLYRRGVDTTGKFPQTWLTDTVSDLIGAAVAVAGALILLFLARQFLGHRTAKVAPAAQPAPTVAMAPSVPMAPSVRMAPSAPMAPSAQAAPAKPPTDGGAIAEQIKKLAELHAAGILTDAEFTSKKAELLSRI